MLHELYIKILSSLRAFVNRQKGYFISRTQFFAKPSQFFATVLLYMLYMVGNMRISLSALGYNSERGDRYARLKNAPTASEKI